MQRCAFTPYEGKKPYIFISYAHKDSHLVFPILEELDRRGFRVWYDDGIAPGSEWPENIAQHLDGCSLTMAFISPNSIASANCRREVTFALSKRKPFLGIVLQPTEMSLGMEMQLSAQQCIMKHTYASDEAFFRKVCSCPDLLPCLGQPKAAPAAADAAAPATPAAPAAPPAPRQKLEKKPVNKKLIGILTGAVAAVAVLTIVLVIALSGGGGTAADQGMNGQNGTTASTSQKPTELGQMQLEYADQVITAQDVAHINQQTQLQTLRMYNCTIEDGAFDRLELAATVTEIWLENCTGVSNLQCLGTLEKLVTLKIINCGITDADLPKLTSRELYFVDVSGNPDFTNLDAFTDCAGIYEIHFANTAVASVTALAGMEDLYTVNGSYTKVTDLTTVTNLTELRQVYFAGCGIESIETPFYSLYLEALDLSENLLTDMQSLTYCTALQKVDLSYNDLMYPEMLKKSTASLKELNLSGNPHLYDFRLDFLADCTNMEKLSMDGIDLGDLELIKSMHRLKYLSLMGCGVSSLENLGQMTELEYLNLASNKISDISPLTAIDSAQMVLELSYNSYLTDLTALPDLDYAYLGLFGIVPHTMPSVSGGTLTIGFDEAWKEPGFIGSDSFDLVVVVDCPLDQVVAMENCFGKERLVVINEVEDYLQMMEEQGIDCSYLRACLQG